MPNNKMAFEVGGVCDSLHGHCDASNLVQVDGEDGEDRELQESNSADSRDCPFCTSGSQGEVLYCEELDGDPFAEHHEEEEPSPDETVADGEAEDLLNAMGLTSAGSINGDVETVGIRRVLQAEGAHGAADGDETRVPDEGGADDGREADDEDESFEVEETPAERYQRYLQSTKGEVSDQVSWAEMHYGSGTRDEDEHGDMVMIWLQRDRGQGMMMRVMASLDPKHGQNHWQNNDPQNRDGQSHADAC